MVLRICKWALNISEHGTVLHVNSILFMSFWLNILQTYFLVSFCILSMLHLQIFINCVTLILYMSCLLFPNSNWRKRHFGHAIRLKIFFHNKMMTSRKLIIHLGRCFFIEAVLLFRVLITFTFYFFRIPTVFCVWPLKDKETKCTSFNKNVHWRLKTNDSTVTWIEFT